jgi:hypothetical protein
LPQAIEALQTALHLLTELQTHNGQTERLQEKIAWVQEQLQRLRVLTDGDGAPQRLEQKGT